MDGNKGYPQQQNYPQQPQQPQQPPQYPQYQQQPYGGRYQPYPPYAPPKPIDYGLIMGLIGFFGLLLIGIGAIIIGAANSYSTMQAGWYLIGIGAIIVSLEKLVGMFAPKK